MSLAIAVVLRGMGAIASASKLHLFTEAGQVIPTPEEAAEQEQQRAERLTQKLRELGIDPADV